MQTKAEPEDTVVDMYEVLKWLKANQIEEPGPVTGLICQVHQADTEDAYRLLMTYSSTRIDLCPIHVYAVPCAQDGTMPELLADTLSGDFNIVWQGTYIEECLSNLTLEHHVYPLYWTAYNPVEHSVAPATAVTA